MGAERPDFEQFAREKVAQIPPPLRSLFEAHSKLMIAWHTGSDAFGKRIMGDKRRLLRVNMNALEKKIEEQYGTGRTFHALEYEYGLDNPDVRSLLAGGLSESERTPRPARKPKQ